MLKERGGLESHVAYFFGQYAGFDCEGVFKECNWRLVYSIGLKDGMHARSTGRGSADDGYGVVLLGF